MPFSKRKSLKGNYSILNKSLFICYSTPNYSKLTNIFLNSLNDINVKNIEHKLDIPSNDLLYNTGFQTDLWYSCLKNKILHLINVLNKYNNFYNIKYFVFTDCDIVYIKKNIKEWDNLENYILNENKDIFFMREGTSDDVNSGFYIIKNNSNIKTIINFLIEVLKTFDESKKENMPFGDQSIINSLKNNINYGYIPNDYVIFGTNIFNKNKSLFHHAIDCKDVHDKILQINQIKSEF